MTNSTSITLKTTIIFLIFSLNLFVNIESLRLEIESGSTRCMSEEIKRNAMTVGTYNVISPIEDQPLPPSHRIAARVTSPRGNDYHYKDGVEYGNFSFTAGDTGNYMTCFWAPTHYPITKISIEFEWKTGINTRDWHNIAQKGHIDLLDGELKRLYETVKSIHDEMFYLREREEEMQELNKATKSKMALFSFFSIILVMSVALLQLWHLKGYFERKKLL